MEGIFTGRIVGNFIGRNLPDSPDRIFYRISKKHTIQLFGAAQPLAYIPLNLVISDVSYYFTEVLKPLPYANLYIAYLGWIPVLLGIAGVKFIPHKFSRFLYLS